MADSCRWAVCGRLSELRAAPYIPRGAGEGMRLRRNRARLFRTVRGVRARLPGPNARARRTGRPDLCPAVRSASGKPPKQARTFLNGGANAPDMEQRSGRGQTRRPPETTKNTEPTTAQQARTTMPSTCSPASSQPRNTPMTGLTYSYDTATAVRVCMSSQK